MLADLRALPRAREIPPCLGKRDRSGAAAEGARCRKSPADPTAALLQEAAAQLRSLVELQAQRRRMLKALRGGGCAWADDASSCGGSDSDGESAESAAPRAADPRQVCASMGAADSVSVQSVSLASSSGGRGCEAPPPQHAHLQRQYALDLDDLCHRIGQRLPLPGAQQAQG